MYTMDIFFLYKENRLFFSLEFFSFSSSLILIQGLPDLNIINQQSVTCLFFPPFFSGTFLFLSVMVSIILRILFYHNYLYIALRY